MRQEIGHLIQQVIAQFGIFNAHMHMHAADKQPFRQMLHIFGENIVAILVRMPLDAPFRKRMGRGRDRPQSMAFCRRHNAGAKLDYPLTCFGNGMTDRRPDFDLRA